MVQVHGLGKFFLVFFFGLTLIAARGDTTNTAPGEFVAHARQVYCAASSSYENEPTNSLAAWQFAKAAFDLGEFATNDTERATLAVAAIAVCRQLITQDAKSAPGYFYLGMNLGQLARTKTLGALKLVDEMEAAFKTARTLDEKFADAGPDRNLGMLYYEAPGWPASIGSNSKARKHFERAVQLAPDYPENRLNLAEAYLKWRDKKSLEREIDALDKLWPTAQTKLVGPDWAAAWQDWQVRLEKLHAASRRK